MLAYTEDFGRLLHGLMPGVPVGSVLLGCFAVLWTVFECAALVATQVFGALINDVVPRPVLGRCFGMFRAVSLIAGMTFNFLIFKHAETYARPILISIAAVFLVGVTAMCLRVREGGYPSPATEPPGRRWYGVWTCSFGYLRACFGIGYYRWVFAGLTLAGLMFQPVNLFSYPYAKSAGLADGDIGFLTGLTYAISLVLAWPLGWLVDKAHALRCSLWMLAGYAASMAVAGGDGRGTPTP